ncbi:hypothetical protein PR202_gb01721 [Eleusine coracana subsp. coracana]|uniref:Uncharacterized protein n=1 Tax=Eleusine coracana subsp. coracana TaxID=191504 RepID=A0AAV5DXD5_ELECO|nr:hypothetical protein PR202_gb01721 [Eleusine coracana subsp. coracana]
MPEAPPPPPPAGATAAPPESHREALEYIERVTSSAGEVQRRVLAEILSQNAPAEYLRRLGVSGAAPTAVDDFRRAAPLVTYEDILPDVLRIANGDTSPILSGKPIREFLTSSGTSGGERKLMPTIADEMDRRSLLYSLLMPVMSRAVPGLDKGKAMYLYFVKAESRTPGGLPARPVCSPASTVAATSWNGHTTRTPCTPAPTRRCCAWTRTRACTRSFCAAWCTAPTCSASAPCFASGFLSAPSGSWRSTGRACAVTSGPASSTPRSPTAPCGERWSGCWFARTRTWPTRSRPSAGRRRGRGSSGGVWPRTKYIDVIVTGAMAQYIPTLEFYGGGLPLTCTMYASSECYFGLNLNPMCSPSDVAYTLIPTMCYFEFLPVHHSSSGGGNVTEPDHPDLVDLVDVKARTRVRARRLYRYRVGDVLRVAGFKNQAPQFNFVRRKNVALSIDSDKTDEAELHAAVSGAVTHLAPFGASLVEYTSYADATTIPGHYVLFWELRAAGKTTPVPASVFEDCCLAVEEALNSVYRQGRAADRSIGPLEIRVVSDGTFDKLMDYALARGASINQYKAPRCVRPGPVVDLLQGRVQATYFSPKCPKWSPGSQQWSGNNGGV